MKGFSKLYFFSLNPVRNNQTSINWKYFKILKVFLWDLHIALTVPIKFSILLNNCDLTEGKSRNRKSLAELIICVAENFNWRQISFTESSILFSSSSSPSYNEELSAPTNLNWQLSQGLQFSTPNVQTGNKNASKMISVRKC